MIISSTQICTVLSEHRQLLDPALESEKYEEATRIVAEEILRLPNFTKAQWIIFAKTGETESGLTSIYQVRTKEEGVLLGEIRWFGMFRSYSFFPAPDTIYETRCLADISNFIENLMKLHRQSKNQGQKPRQQSGQQITP
jgi:hypothetical protein